MRDPSRIIKVLQEIAVYWIERPDLRLGQIISNASSSALNNPDPFYLEEDALILAIRGMECPACRDRHLLSKCHHCGREGLNPELIPYELGHGFWPDEGKEKG